MCDKRSDREFPINIGQRRRYFVYLAYDGSKYHGWQIQPNGISVQECLNKALSTLLRQTVEVVGAGRTDAEVNAALMVAHFDITDAEIDVSFLTDKLNRLLPPDIGVFKVVPVCDDAHARFDALARTYKYYVVTAKSPFRRHYAHRVFGQLDFARMNEAASVLLRHADFTSFSRLHTDVKTNICRVTYARWEQTDENEWCFTITADRFLRNMVRAIVGTLLEVGRGKLTTDDFEHIIECKNRGRAGTSAPGNALFLWNIDYPERIFLSGGGGD